MARFPVLVARSHQGSQGPWWPPGHTHSSSRAKPQASHLLVPSSRTVSPGPPHMCIWGPALLLDIPDVSFHGRAGSSPSVDDTDGVSGGLWEALCR